MIHQTRGVVLNHIKFAETSIIVHVYTELFGRQSYMVNQVRSSKGKGKTVFLQPLAMMELQVYHSPKKEVQRIKDFRVAKPFVSVPFEQTKRSVAFFVTEVLNRSLREEEANPELFDFLWGEVDRFDSMTGNAHAFHLSFLAKLTRFLGFFPDFTAVGQCNYFDLRQGEFCGVQPQNSHFLTGDMLGPWQLIFGDNHFNVAQLGGGSRQRLNELLLEYYALHLEGFGVMKSLDVLKDLYSGA